MSIKTILISQPEPSNDNSPYSKLISKHKIKIDYSFYISNQLMKPIQQVFALVLEKIWKDQNKLIKIKKFKSEIQKLKKTCEEDKFESKFLQSQICILV